MAIPKFVGQWLKKRGYPGVIQTGIPPIVSSFSIDMNSVIHQCAQKTYAYGDNHDPRRHVALSKMKPIDAELELFNMIGLTLLNLVLSVQPVDTLNIAIDGVVPMAKMAQQRQRRYKNSPNKASDPNKGPSDPNKGSVNKGPSPFFDSNVITPGTDFMIRLDAWIESWIESNKEKLPVNVVFSGHLVPGEGEHKIFDLIRSDTRLYPRNKSHIIYGMDADLIMLSMLCPLEQIQLMREESAQDNVIDIYNLRIALSQDLNTDSETAVNDFVIMMYFMGNDFLPHLPAFDDFALILDRLFGVYLKLGKPLTSPTDGINWENLSIFLEMVSAIEPELMETVAGRPVKYPSRMVAAATKVIPLPLDANDIESGGIKKVFDFNSFRSAWYQNELTPRGPRELIGQVVTMTGMDIEDIVGVHTDEIERMCVYYLVGLAWVYRYYHEGTLAVNQEYCYPFFHAPFASDIAAVIVGFKINNEEIYYRKDMKVTPLHQQMIVMPPASSSLVAAELKELYELHSPIYDLLPHSFLIEKDGKNEDYMAIALVPPTDIYRVHKAIIGITLTMSDHRKELLLVNKEPLIFDFESVQEARRETLSARKRIEEIAYGPRGRRPPRGAGTRGRGVGTRDRDSYDASRGRGSYKPRGRGRGSYDDRGRGRGGYGRGYDPGRGRGNYDASRGRGNFETPRGQMRSYQETVSEPKWASLKILM